MHGCFFYRSEVAAVADEGANASSTGNIVEVKATSARITFSSFCIAHSFFLFIYCTVLYCIVALVIFPDLIDDTLTCRQTMHVSVCGSSVTLGRSHHVGRMLKQTR